MKRGLLVILLVLAWPASAAERWHTVAYGESLSGIARQYYGDFSHADWLLRFNGRSGTELRPGERLRIPYSVEHRIEPGDNGSTLARRYLGRASSWGAIALLNGMDPGAALQPGRAIEMPAVLRHTLVRGDSLSSLAGKYYGDPSRGALLQDFNVIADPRDLDVGEIVEIPLIGIRLSEPKEPVRVARKLPKTPPPDPEPEAASEPVVEVVPVETPVPPAPEPVTPVMPEWFAGDYASAENAFVQGDYETARSGVEELIRRIDSIPLPAEQARVWRLAAFVDVAFDRPEGACAAFLSMALTDAEVEVGPDVSPKVRDVLASCDPGDHAESVL